MALHHLEIFLGIQRRRALYPRMNGIGSDYVEPLRRGEYIVPGIIKNDLRPAITQYIVILPGEMARAGLRNQWFQLANENALHLRVCDKRPGGHSGAASHHQ